MSVGFWSIPEPQRLEATFRSPVAARASGVSPLEETTAHALALLPLYNKLRHIVGRRLIVIKFHRERTASLRH